MVYQLFYSDKQFFEAKLPKIDRIFHRITQQDIAGHKGTIRIGDVQIDSDMGNYEPFLDATLTEDNNITTGKMYQSMLEKKRRGEYLSKTVQVMVQNRNVHISIDSNFV
ncbi:hypothetical protein ACFX2I_036195 [Malus domestica]